MGMSILCPHVYVCKLNWEIEECDICVQLLLPSSRPSPLHFDPYFGVSSFSFVYHTSSPDIRIYLLQSGRGGSGREYAYQCLVANSGSSDGLFRVYTHV